MQPRYPVLPRGILSCIGQACRAPNGLNRKAILSS
jgi:hypothetical protein